MHWLLELRVWGLGPEVHLRRLAKLALSVTIAVFRLVLCSGLLMFAANPAEVLSHRAFLIELGLVHLAGINAAWFHGRDSRVRCNRVARE